MRAGFSLIELVIVMSISMIVMAISLPNLIETKQSANESRIVSHMKTELFSAMEEFRAAGHNDIDGDKRGEYGHLDQLSGDAKCFGTRSPDGYSWYNRDYIDYEILNLDLELNSTQQIANGVDTFDPNFARSFAPYPGSSGYSVASWICPGSETEPQEHGRSGYHVGQLRINAAERGYCITAVPETYGSDGRRVFVMTQEGKILAGHLDHHAHDRPDFRSRHGLTANAAIGTRQDAANPDYNRRPLWQPLSK